MPVGTPPATHPVDTRTTLGSRGEQIAVDHLTGLGFTVLARNHRTRHGEIDAVAYRDRLLVFVEVKTRRVPDAAHGTAASGQATSQDPQSIGWPRRAQRLRARRLALEWLAAGFPGSPPAREIRFDVIMVALAQDGSRVSLQHLEGTL